MSDGLRDEYICVAPSEACAQLEHSTAWIEVSAHGDKGEFCAECTMAWRLAHRAGSEDFADKFVQSVRRNEFPGENLDAESTIE
jgi:hypothetical protein